MTKRRARPKRRRSAIVPAAVFALAIGASTVPTLAGCGDDYNGVADIAFSVAAVGFDFSVSKDLSTHD